MLITTCIMNIGQTRSGNGCGCSYTTARLFGVAEALTTKTVPDTRFTQIDSESST